MLHLIAETFSHVREKVNVCKVLPSATLNLRANVLDPKTNKKDPDFRFCFIFDSWKAVKFPDIERETCVRESTPSPTPPPVGPSKGKNSGGKPSRRRYK